MQEPTYYEVPFEIARSFIASWSDREITSPAPVTPTETATMKVLLVDALTSYNQRVNYEQYYAIEIGKYGVQYTPYYNKQGERRIWVNGFMLKQYSSFYNEKDGDYSRGVVFGIDGGNQYFQTTINLTKQEIAPVRINGTA